MKNQKFMRKLSSFILIFALVFALVPGGSIGFASGIELGELESLENQIGFKLIGYEDKDILSLEKVEFKENETALDFSKRLLDENKISYNADGGYFSEIDGLKAMDKGIYSGWMVRLNGEMPSVGLGDLELKPGDLLEIFYVQNYNSLYEEGRGQLLVEGFEEEKILSTDFIDFREGETALDFSKRILDENKIGYNADGGYFSEVNGLKAMDKGPRSGWMVKVNDLMPEVGLGDIDMESGMVVKLFFVEDYETLFPPTDGGDVDELFTDMEGFDWAKDAVESLAIDGVIEGTGNNKFNPKGEISRADFAVMVSRLLRLEDIGEVKFKDVKPGSYYHDHVLRLANKGYIKGRTNGNFDPKTPIKRQEIASIIGNILEDEGFRLKDKEVLKVFKDHKSIGDFAVKGASLSVQEGIIEGSGQNFLPTKKASRAEAATMLYRLSNKIK